MKKNNYKIKFCNEITKLLLYFVSIFAMLSMVLILISVLSGNSYLGSYFTWEIIFIATILLSFVYYFVLKINRITQPLQIITIYFSFALVTYLVCFILRIFSLHSKQNLYFFLISVGITLVVFGFLLFILLAKQYKETRKLNKYLNKFKERDK